MLFEHILPLQMQLLGYLLRSNCPCLVLCLLGKRLRNYQLIVLLPVRRRAGQAIFDCSRECSGTPLVCPCPGTRASNQRTQTHTSTDSTHKQANAHRERERERKKEREREREREREKHHSLLSMTCIPHLHRSLAPRDPNQLLPLGLANGLHFCGTRIPPTRGVAPLSPHSAGRIGGTTAPSSQTHCPPQSTPKQSPPKQRQSHRAQGTTAPCLQMHCPSSPPKQHASPKPQASPKQRRLPRM